LLVPQTLVISPLSAMFGRDSQIVDDAFDLVGGIRVTHGDDMPASGFQVSSAWGTRSAPR
jgi:hypothetical protein